MSNNKPIDLTVEEWKLLLHLHRYDQPFCKEDVYAVFYERKTTWLVFVKNYYRLVQLYYITLYSSGEQVVGRKQLFYFEFTPKGRESVAASTHTDSEQFFVLPINFGGNKRLTEANSVKTIQVPDYSF